MSAAECDTLRRTWKSTRVVSVVVTCGEDRGSDIFTKHLDTEDTNRAQVVQQASVTASGELAAAVGVGVAGVGVGTSQLFEFAIGVRRRRPHGALGRRRRRVLHALLYARLVHRLHNLQSDRRNDTLRTPRNASPHMSRHTHVVPQPAGGLVYGDTEFPHLSAVPETPTDISHSGRHM